MHVAGVRFTTLFILTHIKRFFIMFRTNCWTDVFVVRLLAHRGPGAASEIYREFRTSRKPLNVAFVRAGLPEQETLCPAPPEPHGSHC